jgi:hypothetical protein
MDELRQLMGAFQELPARVFLDSSTLQALLDYGAFVWENEPIPEEDKIHRHPHLLRNVEALRLIFRVNERAGWQFVISAHSLDEVKAKADGRYLRWAYDVLDHWHVCLEESRELFEKYASIAARLDHRSVGYLGAGDRELLKNAVQFGCDVFLTMEVKLPKNSVSIEALTGLRVLTPEGYWAQLEPWAALWC